MQENRPEKLVKRARLEPDEFDGTGVKAEQKDLATKPFKRPAAAASAKGGKQAKRARTVAPAPVVKAEATGEAEDTGDELGIWDSMNDAFSKPADKHLSQTMHCRRSRVYKRALTIRRDSLLAGGKSIEDALEAAIAFARYEHGKVGQARAVCKNEEGVGSDDNADDIW